MHIPADAANRWVAGHRWALAVGMVAALPIIVSTVEVLAAGWTPLADDALVAVSAYDVFTSDSPLLGPWSSGYSRVVGEPTFHPGPLLFWLLAVPTRLAWPGALEVTAGLVNVASVMGVILLARRRGGTALMFAAGIALPVMLASLPAEVYSDIWNPSIPVLPFTLLIFLSWSLACGDYRLLPLTVLVASFVVQCHLSFLVPAAGAFGVGVAGLALGLRDQRSRAEGRSIDERRRRRRWLVAALVVALLCWSGPLIDQLANRPGNLQLIYRAILADQKTAGWDQGVRALVHTVGVVPWWLGEPQGPFERVADLVSPPGAVADGSAVVILVALASVTVAGWRRRRRDIWSAGALGVVLCAAVALVTASTPESSVTTLGYSLRWASPAGMWAWVALAWSLAALIPPPRRFEVWRRTWFRPAAVLVVAAVAVVVAVGGELPREPYRQMRTLADRLAPELSPRDAVRVDVATSPDSALSGLGFLAGTVSDLRHEGRTVAAPAVAEYLGPEYDHGRYDQIVGLFTNLRPPSDRRTIARLTVTAFPDPAGDPFAPKTPPKRVTVVTLASADAER